MTDSQTPVYNPQVFRGPGRARDLCEHVKYSFLRAYDTHRTTILLGCNVFGVIMMMVLLARIFSCDKDSDVVIVKEDNVLCEPFVKTDNIVIDIELNTTAHCYSSASCVALSQSLRKQQSYYRYNFIIGIYGFVYVGRGYQCRSQDERPGLYIQLPVDSIYNGTDFMASHKAVNKFRELLREGLECNRVAHNYTITARGCGPHDDWCSRAMQAYVTDVSDREPLDGVKVEYRDHTTPGGLYDPSSLRRVYNQHFKLVVCTSAVTQ